MQTLIELEMLVKLLFSVTDVKKITITIPVLE